MGVLDSVLSVGSGLLGYASARETNQANKEQSREQMRFQERMSNTAYQRARADLTAAGFNPLLAVSQGGASSPAGSMATMQNPSSSAIQAMQSRAELQKTASDIVLNHALAESARSSARKSNADAKISENAEPRSRVLNTLYRVAEPLANSAESFTKFLSHPVQSLDRFIDPYRIKRKY
jgi:hypothetical protein